MPGHYLCVPVVHTPTQQAYSVIHLAIQLSYLLVLLGLFLYLHHQCETFTQNNLDTVRITFQFTGANAVPAHYFEFFDDFQKSCIFMCLFVLGFFLFFNLLLSKAAYVYDFVYKSNTCLSPFTKGMVNYFLKKLPVPKNNLAAPWLASLMQPLGKLSD